MKNLTITLFISCFFALALNAQDVSAQLEEAKSAYKSGELQNTRFALQLAINEIDRAIGQEVLKILPETIGNMQATETGDELTSTNMGFAGIYVVRSYKNDEGHNSNIQIISDSPLLAGINAILSLPMIGGNPNQKRVKIGNYRGLMQKNDSDTDIVSWDVQIPFGSSLLTFHCEGISDEKTIITMANTIPVDKIAKLVQ